MTEFTFQVARRTLDRSVAVQGHRAPIQAHAAFGLDGGLLNRQLDQRLRHTVAVFLDLAEAARDYPCVRAAWYEFLGERADAPATGRVQVGGRA